MEKADALVSRLVGEAVEIPGHPRPGIHRPSRNQPTTGDYPEGVEAEIQSFVPELYDEISGRVDQFLDGLGLSEQDDPLRDAAEKAVWHRLNQFATNPNYNR